MYCVLGHFSHAVKLSSPPLKRAKNKRTAPAVPRPSQFENYDAYKLAISQLCRQARSHTVATFVQLRLHNKPEADRFLSTFFNKSKSFFIALTDEETGQLYDTRRALGLLSEDIQKKCSNTFPQDEVAAAQLKEQIQLIRKAGALRTAPPGVPSTPLITTGDYPQQYSFEETCVTLDSICVSKVCLRCPYAALRSECLAGREVTHELVNMSRIVALVSTHWGTRCISNIRKSGPRIVRKAKHLRPVSLAVDLLAVVDSLWLRRCRLRIETFVGPNQMGGRFDAVVAVVVVILLVQLRSYQGLDSYLFQADAQWAFDTASHHATLLAVYSAGVAGAEWRLFDDMISMDKVSVQLTGVVSQTFSFVAGIAQGRKLSLHTFMSGFSLLEDIMNAVQRTASPILPSFARDVLDTVARMAPTVVPRMLLTQQSVASVVQELRHLCADQGYDDQTVRHRTQALLLTLPTQIERQRALEALGTGPSGPFFFVDDVTAPYACIEDVAQIVSIALPQYERFAKAKFNYGLNKTAVLPMLQAPVPTTDEVGCPVAFEYKQLGVLIDSQLTFDPRLRHVLRVGQALFLELSQVCETIGFSVPVAAAQTLVRVVPIVLYAAEILALHGQAEAKLNTLQAGWAKTLLGCRNSQWMRGSLAVAQCGWQTRLGTLMVERIIVGLARIQTYPAWHPAAVMCFLTEDSLADTWVSRVHGLMNNIALETPIPTVWKSGLFPPGILKLAQKDASVRRAVLKTYRLQVVRPALATRDAAAFRKDADKVPYGFGCCFRSLQQGLMPLPAAFFVAVGRAPSGHQVL
ncbi:unnamed protein product [Polarella glacialis]|uniref:Uncharacterized protein n=1 Tax=Polarella glacialis TaxID=89957 RepID=A0A813I846_POLGL|nr:unnamed protein product [Polarella glacialis]